MSYKDSIFFDDNYGVQCDNSYNHYESNFNHKHTDDHEKEFDLGALLFGFATVGLLILAI